MHKRPSQPPLMCGTSPHPSTSRPSTSPTLHPAPPIEIELRDVYLTLGGKPVISGLNLRIAYGEALAIIGTSGTGKSTTLRIISGLLMPTKGTVLLRGRPRQRSITNGFALRKDIDEDEDDIDEDDDDDDASDADHNESSDKSNPRVRPYNDNGNGGNDDSGKAESNLYYNSHSLRKKPRLPRISMVFQNAALLDSLTVGENVALGLSRTSKLKDDAQYSLVRTWLSRVGLSDAMDKRPEQLSGGMRKRASVARAVIFDPAQPATAPDILLYDEPTAGLDPTGSTRIENLIRDVKPYCPTSVIVTHQFSTIRRTADRVVFLHEGRAVWQGLVSQLDTTDNPYVRQFMSASLNRPLSDDTTPNDNYNKT